MAKLADVEEHIKGQIGKSGFPLEVISSITLSKHAWSVHPHIIYYDKIVEKYSELDLLAIKANKRIRHSRDVLIIQCKKQEEKPWALFEQDESIENVTSLNMTPMNIYGWFEANIFKDHYYFNKKPCGYHFPAFVKKGKPDTIVDALVQVINALLFFMAQELTYIEQHRSKRVSLFYPVIILDGRLFSARVKPDGDIRLAESKYLQLRVTRALEEPMRLRWSGTKSRIIFWKDFIVDIVVKEYLEEFIKNFS